MQWMAPEMFRGDEFYTRAVDVYSFGVVLYELATRKIEPWAGELPTGELEFFRALKRALQAGRRPTVPDDVSAEHGDFVAVIERCWAGDPADRPEFSLVVSTLATCLRDTP